MAWLTSLEKVEDLSARNQCLAAGFQGDDEGRQRIE